MLETIAVVIVLGLIIIVGRVLAAGTEAIIAGIFPPQGQPDWPRGVQDEDVPRFVLGRTA
jgi:hypothetical protein